MKGILIYIVIAFSIVILSSCSGTLPNVINPRPLPEGTSEFRGGFSIPLNSLNLVSVYGVYTIGIDGKSNFSVTWPQLFQILPGSVNYTNYFKYGNRYINLNIGIYDLFNNTYNPDIQIGSGIEINENLYLYSNLGYFTKSLFTSFINSLEHHPGGQYFDFSMGLQISHGDYFANAQYNSTISEYYIDYYKNKFGYNQEFKINQDEVENINIEDDKIIIDIKGDSSYVLAKKDPYPDCFSCAISFQDYSIYSDDQSYFFGIKSDSTINKLSYEYNLIIPNSRNIMVDVNPNEIENQLEEKGSFQFISIEERINMAKQNVKWYNNFIFSIGQIGQ